MESAKFELSKFELRLLYLCLILGIRYSRNAPSKSYFGAKPQSRRAALSSTSSGQESTMPWRFVSTWNVTSARGNARSTSVRISSAVGANAPRL